MTNFSAGNKLKDYIEMIGYSQTQVKSSKKYFVNKQGKQIRIDEYTGYIAFINNRGFVEAEHRLISDIDIKEFSAN